MRIVFLGAPGSGKGTQASRLKAELGLAHISTGELLRAAVAAGSELGQRVKAVMEAGQLVSDALMLGILEQRMAQPDVAAGFILDGYPRNLNQAAALDAMLQRIGQPVMHAVQLDVDSELLIERLAKRAAQEGRKDDNPETVRARQQVYQQQTEPVLEHYRAQGKLRVVDGVGTLDEVYARILAALGR